MYGLESILQEQHAALEHHTNLDIQKLKKRKFRFKHRHQLHYKQDQVNIITICGPTSIVALTVNGLVSHFQYYN